MGMSQAKILYFYAKIRCINFYCFCILWNSLKKFFTSRLLKNGMLLFAAYAFFFKIHLELLWYSVQIYFYSLSSAVQLLQQNLLKLIFPHKLVRWT